MRSSLEDVRRIALELRPEALDDLGLASAGGRAVRAIRGALGDRVDQRVDEDLPELGHETSSLSIAWPRRR